MMATWMSIDERLLAAFLPTGDEQEGMAGLRDRSAVEQARSEIRYGYFGDAARMLEEVAQSIESRVGEASPASESAAQALLAVAYSVWGQGLEAWGDPEGAHDYFARSASTFRSVFGDQINMKTLRDSIGARALSDYGMALAGTGDDDNALQALEASRRAGASTPEALRRLATYALQKGRPDDARRLLTDVLPIIPTDAESWHVEAMIRDQLVKEEHSGDIAAAYRQAAALWLQRGAFRQALPSLHRLRQLGPDDERTLVALSEALRGTDLPAEAEAVARRALELRPDFLEARLSLALALRASGRLAEALDAASIAVEDAPGNPVAHTVRALLCLETGDPEGSLADAERALEVEHDLREALLAKGRALIALDRPHDAREPLEHANRMSPQDVELAGEAAWLASLEGDADVVIEILEPHGYANALRPREAAALAEALMAVGRTDAAVDVADWWARQRPDDQELQLLRAKTLAHQHVDWELSLQDLRKVVNEVASLAPAEPDVLVLKAQLAREEERLQDAELLLTDALQRQPGHNVALQLLSQLLLDEDRPTDAEHWARQGLTGQSASWFKLQTAIAVSRQERHREALALLEKMPEDLDEHNLVVWLQVRAGACEALNRWAAARAAWEELTQLLPDDVESWFALADSARLAGDSDAAVAASMRVLELQPDHMLVRGTLAAALADEGRLNEAREQLAQALALDPGYEFALSQGVRIAETLDEALEYVDRLAEAGSDPVTMHLNRGLALMDFEKYPEALQSFEEVLSIDADNVSALTDAARCRTALGQPDKAIDLAQRAVDLQPDDVFALSALGRAQERSGLGDDALLTLRRAHDLAPDNYPVLEQLLVNLRNADAFEESVTLLEDLVQRRPGDAELWRAVGTHLKEMGYFAEAGQALDRCVQIHPQDAWAHNDLGEALEHRDPPDLTAALHHYLRANDLGQGMQQQQLLNLADLRHQLGHREAQEDYERILATAEQETTTDPYARWVIGWCWFRLGELEQAGRHLFSATSLPDEGDEVRLDLALVSLCRGRDVEALRNYRAAVEGLTARGGRRRLYRLVIARSDLAVARQDWPRLEGEVAEEIDALLERAADEVPRVPVSQLLPG